MNQKNDKKDFFMNQKVVSFRIPTTLDMNFRKHCEIMGKSGSERIKELIKEDLKPKMPKIISGQNEILYDSETDSFKWVVNLDVTIEWDNKPVETNKRQITIAKNIPKEFVENIMQNSISALKSREISIQKTKKKSIGIPRDIIGVKDE